MISYKLVQDVMSPGASLITLVVLLSNTKPIWLSILLPSKFCCFQFSQLYTVPILNLNAFFSEKMRLVVKNLAFSTQLWPLTEKATLLPSTTNITCMEQKTKS